MMVDIRPAALCDKDQILLIAKKAWAPVMTKMKPDVPGFVFEAFYPQGWWPRQSMDITALFQDMQTELFVALSDGTVRGFMGLRQHPDDSMAEIYILGVDPDYQRQGLATALMHFAELQTRQNGLSMLMVETGGDLGHAASRSAYEAFGFERWPVARYFRRL